jgi:membrane protease YdiL (CAAX protease family)
MKQSPSFKFIAGFICLFLLYHTAEYMILFKKNPAGFLIFQAFFFAAAWIIAQWQFKQGLSAWGLNTKKHLFRHLLLGMMMGIILYGLTYFINLVAGVEVKVAIPQFSYIAGPLLLFMFGNFFSSLSEDVLTRGYLYQHLNRKVSVPALIFISAAVYLFNHIYRLDDGPITWLYLFLLGILFVIPLILTKRLWFTGGMHWAGNSFFYFTHDLIITQSGKTDFSANYTLCICILLVIPLNYYLLKKLDLLDVDRSNHQPATMNLV